MFLFYNELDLLTYRLNILNDYVDYFVICESAFTFTGTPKKSFYLENISLFETFSNKIIHILLDTVPYRSPNYDQGWKNEHYQRNGLSQAFSLFTPEPTDVIVFGDLDEIVNPVVVKKIKEKEFVVDRAYNLEMDLYYYNFLCKYDRTWNLAKLIDYETFKKLNFTFQQLRTTNSPYTLPTAGWHMSYFGDVKFIANKLRSFSHQEYSHIASCEKDIEERMQTSADLFNRPDVKWKHVPLNENTHLPPLYTVYLSKYT